MSYTPRNVLVTGGAGFIGANYVRWLLGEDAGVRIVNLDALTYAGSTDNLKGLPGEGRHTFVQGDICDAALVARLLREHAIDTVVYFRGNAGTDAKFISYNKLLIRRKLWIGVCLLG